MNYQINFQNFKNNFSLPSLLFEDLQHIPSDYLKVILLIFKSPDKEYSVSLLSNLLNLQEEVVTASLQYWIEKKVLHVTERSVPEQQPAVHMVHTAKQPAVSSLNDSELRFLIGDMEQILGRTVTSTDIKTISYIYEYYRLPADVIIMAIQYAVKNEKRDIRYIEKVCINWYEQGVTSHTAVEEFLKRVTDYQQKEKQVQKLLGIADRKLIPSEEKWIRIWLEEYHFELDVIQLAYERTVKNTGKAALAYMNKILQNWHQKGLHTLEQIEQKDGGKRPVKEGDSEKSYDIDLLERYWDNVPTLD